MQFKTSKYIIGTYAVILLLSLALFYIVPKKDLIDCKPSPAAAGERVIYQEAAARGELDRLEGMHRYRQWSFHYPGDSLEIAGDGASFQIMVTVKRTPVGTDGVKAAEYRRDTIFMDRLKPYRVTLSGNRLTISPEEYRLILRGFSPDVTVNQFKRGKEIEYHEWLFYDFNFAQELYLYIPADLKLEHDPDRIQLVMVNEE